MLKTFHTIFRPGTQQQSTTSLRLAQNVRRLRYVLARFIGINRPLHKHTWRRMAQGVRRMLGCFPWHQRPLQLNVHNHCFACCAGCAAVAWRAGALPRHHGRPAGGGAPHAAVAQQHRRAPAGHRRPAHRCARASPRTACSLCTDACTGTWRHACGHEDMHVRTIANAGVPARCKGVVCAGCCMTQAGSFRALRLCLIL